MKKDNFKQFYHLLIKNVSSRANFSCNTPCQIGLRDCIYSQFSSFLNNIEVAPFRISNDGFQNFMLWQNRTKLLNNFLHDSLLRNELFENYHLMGSLCSIEPMEPFEPMEPMLMEHLLFWKLHNNGCRHQEGRREGRYVLYFGFILTGEELSMKPPPLFHLSQCFLMWPYMWSRILVISTKGVEVRSFWSNH